MWLILIYLMVDKTYLNSNQANKQHFLFSIQRKDFKPWSLFVLRIGFAFRRDHSSLTHCFPPNCDWNFAPGVRCDASSRYLSSASARPSKSSNFRKKQLSWNSFPLKFLLLIVSMFKGTGLHHSFFKKVCLPQNILHTLNITNYIFFFF